MPLLIELLNLLAALLHNCFKGELFFDHLPENGSTCKPVKKRSPGIKANLSGIEALKLKQQCSCRSEGAEHAAISQYKLQAMTALLAELS